MQSYEYDVFVYLGRTRGPPHDGPQTPKNWLVFQHVDGTGFGNYYGAVNGGVRDVIGAWPMSDYRVYCKHGNFNEDVFCLPPEKCYCFRPVHEIYGEQDSDDEDDDDEEEEDGDEEEEAKQHDALVLSPLTPDDIVAEAIAL